MRNALLWILLSAATLQAQTGDAAVATVQTAKTNHWQNWAFAASAAITAAIAIYVVSIHNGSASTP